MKPQQHRNSETEPLLTAKSVRVQCGNTILLDDIHLHAHAGDIIVVIGENGAGKTTLLDALAGLRPIARGQILACQSDVLAMPSRVRARCICTLGARDPDPDGFTVEERIGQGFVPRLGVDARPGEAERRRIREVAGSLGLIDSLHRPLASLSSGEQRRASVARAFADVEAPILILDEPHAFVDVRHRPALHRLFVERAKAGATIILTTHDPAVAAELATIVMGLKRGRLVLSGAPDDVLTAEGLAHLYDIPAPVVFRSHGAFAVAFPPAPAPGHASSAADSSAHEEGALTASVIDDRK